MCRCILHFQAALWKRKIIIKYLLTSLKTVTNSKQISESRKNFCSSFPSLFLVNFLQCKSQAASWKPVQVYWSELLEGFSEWVSDFEEASKIVMFNFFHRRTAKYCENFQRWCKKYYCSMILSPKNIHLVNTIPLTEFLYGDYEARRLNCGGHHEGHLAGCRELSVGPGTLLDLPALRDRLAAGSGFHKEERQAAWRFDIDQAEVEVPPTAGRWGGVRGGNPDGREQPGSDNSRGDAGTGGLQCALYYQHGTILVFMGRQVRFMTYGSAV